MASSSVITPQPPPATGWASLPHDVLRSVFIRLGQHEFLRAAGPACGALWRFARDEPALWRRIDLTPPAVDVVGGDDSDGDFSVGNWMFDEDAAANVEVAMGWKEMARAAVDRSAGRCEAFCGRADDDVLLYLADRAPSLRSLRVTSSYYDVSSEVFSVLIKKFPLLEELELVLIRPDTADNCRTKSQKPSTTRNSWAELLISTCRACPHLNRFTVRGAGNMKDCSLTEPSSSWIPTMHNLRSLELCGDSFTIGLVLDIVDSCPNLESLDISKVQYTSWDEKLEDMCSRIKDLHLPIYYNSDSDDDECCCCSSFE